MARHGREEYNMALEIRPLPVGAELLGWDLDSPPDQRAIAALRSALLDHGMILIRGRELSPDELLALTKLFGDRLVSTGKNFWHSADYPEVFRTTNEPSQVENCGCEMWHCDGHYRMDTCSITVNNVVKAAGGGITLCDNYKIFELLTARNQQALSVVRCMNSTGVYHPLIRRHPATGRRGFYINRYAQSIDPAGNKLPQIDVFIERLLATAAYKHEYEDGDVMIFDNFALTHRACPGDSAKLEVVQRCQTYESATWWLEQPAAQPAPCRIAC
jgi:alpha-ketoglutarate-dependent taurine dioxygenase